MRGLLVLLLILTMMLSGCNVSFAAPLRLLVLGDSLTAGLGLPQGETFPQQLQAELRKQGVDVTVINGGVSGDTTAGGLARLDWLLGDGMDMVILALGANDGLRGLDPDMTRLNLIAMVQRLLELNTKVLIAGMLAPPNLGSEYGAAFNAIFQDVAQEHRVALYPFFLQGVAAVPELNQQDGIHPNKRGVGVMVQGMLPYLLPMLSVNRP